MSKVSVDLNEPSPYIEVDTWFHRFKRRLSYAHAFNLIKKFKPDLNHGVILEIGTGSGYFLAFCNEFLPDAELFGIEYDERLLDTTKKRAPFAHCSQGNAETFNLSSKVFDVVVSFQVIEHLYQPDEMLRRVRDHLKLDGLFIVTTPNLSGLGARLMGEKWHGYRDDHVSLKGVDEWVRLIESHGFKTMYAGSTFFTGIPIMNRLPLGIINWGLLYLFGSWRWRKGESFVGAFYRQ